MKTLNKLNRNLSRFLPYGPRGNILAFFGFIYALRGLVFISPALKAASVPLALGFLPLPVAAMICAFLWFTVGVLVGIWGWRKHHDRALAVWAGFNFLWGFLLIIGECINWYLGITSLLWFSGLFFFGMAGVALWLARMINPIDTMGENCEPASTA